MAILRGYDVSSVRMDKTNLNYLQRGDITVATTSHLQVKYGESTDSFYGTGFSYSPSGSVRGGVVKSIVEKLDGITALKITGLSVSASYLYGRVWSSDEEGFWSGILKRSDSIYGTKLKDYLKGYGGHDTIKAGSGNDTIYGGDGNDTLYGQDGRDTFVFDPTDTGVDRVRDFSTRQDKIHIELPGRPWNSDKFEAGTHSTSANHVILYNSADGSIYYDRDGSGTSPQVLIAKVTAGTALTADHFLLI